jgi:hypothetical protein
MRFMCKASSMTTEERMLLGRVPGEIQDFQFEPGNEYVVVGLQFAVNSNVFGTGVWLHLVNESEKLCWAPLALFEITNGRASTLWRVDATAENQLRIWPDLLYTAFFHEDLGEGEPAVMKAFAALFEQLETEDRARTS